MDSHQTLLSELTAVPKSLYGGRSLAAPP